jgi:hypothetical protein
LSTAESILLITGFVTRLTRRVLLVEQELLTLPEDLSSPLVFSVVRVTQYLVLFVCFVDRCLSFRPFSIGHCVVCSSIYGFWLPLWYLQTLRHISNIHTLISLNPWVRQCMMLALQLFSSTIIQTNMSYKIVQRCFTCHDKVLCA